VFHATIGSITQKELEPQQGLDFAVLTGSIVSSPSYLMLSAFIKGHKGTSQANEQTADRALNCCVQVSHNSTCVRVLTCTAALTFSVQTHQCKM
jgi:hypothetical protein